MFNGAYLIRSVQPLVFRGLSLKYCEMSKNYIFRELECQMTKEEVAELCFKTVRTVTGWDEGKPIPPECKRLMRMAKGRELSIYEEWG